MDFVTHCHASSVGASITPDAPSLRSLHCLKNCIQSYSDRVWYIKCKTTIHTHKVYIHTHLHWLQSQCIMSGNANGKLHCEIERERDKKNLQMQLFCFYFPFCFVLHVQYGCCTVWQFNVNVTRFVRFGLFFFNDRYEYKTINITYPLTNL